MAPAAGRAISRRTGWGRPRAKMTAATTIVTTVPMTAPTWRRRISAGPMLQTPGWYGCPGTGWMGCDEGMGCGAAAGVSRDIE